MVLSNKKLKQKLREAITQSLTSSEKTPNSSNPDSISQTKDSLKALLQPSALKSKLRRKEKRRESLNLKTQKLETQNLETLKLESLENGVRIDGSEDLIEKRKKKKKRKRETLNLKTHDLESLNVKTHNGEDLKVESLESEDRNDGSEGLSEKREKKKRKREDGEKSENVEVKKVSKKKKKKKKKKKSKKNKKSEEKEGGDVTKGANEVIEEVDKIEKINTANGQDAEEAATKVYVGGIPYYSTEDDIRSYFESCGTITEVDCLIFPDSGKFRGIAIINFKTDAAAKRALALDGSDMGGLFLKIAPYKSTKTKKHTEDFSPSVVEGYNRVYAGNLSWDITEDDLKKFFASCKISAIRFGEDKETGEFKGYAHVDFADSLSLNMALKLDQEMVCGRPARVSCAVPAKKKIIVGKPLEINQTSESEVEKENPDVVAASSVTEEVSGKIRRRTCYECGEKGHLSSSCPNKKAADEANGGET